MNSCRPRAIVEWADRSSLIKIIIKKLRIKKGRGIEIGAELWILIVQQVVVNLV